MQIKCLILSSIVIIDCFQRVILEAMLPDDKVYRTIETNSVRACQDYCAAEGDRCQSFSIGISQGGNGTCQLAKTPATESGDRRPKGTIYDPSFDIYNRKKNCFPVNNNAIPTDGKMYCFFIQQYLVIKMCYYFFHQAQQSQLRKYFHNRASLSNPQPPSLPALLAVPILPTTYNQYPTLSLRHL